MLTALDEKMGIEAVEELKKCGLSNLVVYHQLDVTDPTSIASLADFVKTQFGKLDILVCIKIKQTYEAEFSIFLYKPMLKIWDII